MPTFGFDRNLRPAYEMSEFVDAVDSAETVFTAVMNAYLKHDRFDEIIAVYNAIYKLKQAIAIEVKELEIEAKELAEEEARHALAQEIEDNYQMALDNYIDRLIA